MEEKELTAIEQKQDAKRDEHHNLIDELPVIGKLLGNVSLPFSLE